MYYTRDSAVPKRGVMVTDKFGISAFFIDVLVHGVPQIVIFNQAGVPPNFLRPRGCREPKKN
jgi:hypothetical protein